MCAIYIFLHFLSVKPNILLKSRNILENSNFLNIDVASKIEDFGSNSIEFVQRENFLALIMMVPHWDQLSSLGPHGSEPFKGCFPRAFPSQKFRTDLDGF